jgi:hypothetical protein
MNNSRLESLIKFLEICPKCVNGYVSFHSNPAHDFSSIAAIARCYDTKNEYCNVNCSNKKCDNIVSVLNPYFNSKHHSSSKDDSDHSADSELIESITLDFELFD